MKQPAPIEYLQHLFGEDEFDRLILSADAILNEEPDHVRALYWRACALMRLDRMDEALENLDRAIELYDEYADAFSQRGVIFFHKGELQMALDDMDQAVHLESENPYRYSSRAYIRSALDMLEDAIKDYEKAIELDPDDAVAHNNLGLLQEKLGYRGSAQRNFEAADRLMVNQEGELISEDRTTIPPEVNEPMAAPAQPPTLTAIIRNIFTSKAGFKGYLKFMKSLLYRNRK